MANNRGLGKGLSALFSDTESEYLRSETLNTITKRSPLFTEDTAKTAKEVVSEKIDSGKPLKLSLENVYANPNQPRKEFQQESLSELADSISQHGIIQPLTVTPDEDGKYMIIAGERRFRAAKLAGLKEVPVYVDNYTPREIKEIALIENLQREDLNSIEAGIAIRQLMEEYSLTQEQVSKRIGKSRSAVANMLRLLTLPQEITAYVIKGDLSEGHARQLIGLDTYYAIGIARQVIEKNMSVRQLEELLKGKNAKKKPVSKEPLQLSQSRELKDLINNMQRVFGTKVSAMGSDSKGRIYIDYFTRDDLDRIFDLLDKLSKY